MTVTGIVAEFNPLHNGHLYLLSQAEGIKIVVMSGNFVQRGEPAIVDKWIRTQMALESGADIVVELPFLAAVQGADYFAKGAITILSALGVDKLTFGTEESIDYQQLAGTYVDKSEEMENFINNLPDDLSYPQKSQQMWEKFTGIQFTGDTPNHILALAYTKAVAGTDIQLSPIKRIGAGFHSLEEETAIASATAIRHRMNQTEFVEKHTPHHALLLDSPQVSWDNYFSYLKYQIITNPDLTAIYQVNEEIHHRLKKSIRQASTVEDLVDKVATKRYTKARIRRILTYILVNAKDNTLPKAIHVLGFSSEGQAYLSTIKKSVDLVSRIGADDWDALTQRADQIYQMGNPAIEEQTLGRFPVRRT